MQTTFRFILGLGHTCLTRFHHRLGQVENARRHLCIPGVRPDPVELQKLQAVEKHLRKCTDARRINDWKSALREGDAAITAGADFSPQVETCFIKKKSLA
jgi:hypothetical protein